MSKLFKVQFRTDNGLKSWFISAVDVGSAINTLYAQCLERITAIIAVDRVQIDPMTEDLATDDINAKIRHDVPLTEREQEYLDGIMHQINLCF